MTAIYAPVQGAGGDAIWAVGSGVALPGAPTIGVATAGNASATVAFTPPAANGSPAVIDYTVTSSPSGISATAAASPIVVTGLTNGTTYSFTVTARNRDGTGPASAASNSVTPSVGADNTPPTLTGVVTPSNVASTTATISWPVGADNVGVVGYDYRINGGAFALLGNVTTYGLTGLTPSTLYTCDVRARDAAGNVSTPVITGSFTTAVATTGIFNLNSAAYTFKRNNGTPIVSTAVTLFVSTPATGVLVGASITGLSTNGAGIITAVVTNASMVAGTLYRLTYKFTSGEYGVAEMQAA